MDFRDCRSALASLVIVAGFTASFGQINPIKGPPRVTPPPSKPAPKPPVEESVPAAGSGAIDWSYVRVNAPSLVSGAIASVRSGGSDYRSLSGLASGGALKTMGGASSLPKGLQGLLKPSATAPAALQSDGISLRSLLPLELSPSSLRFGNVVDGQRVRRILYIRNAPKGVARASLKTTSPFQILALKALDGRLDMVGRTTWKESGYGAGYREDSGSSAGKRVITNSAPRITRPPASLNPVQIGAGAAPRISDLAKRSEATAAPFEVDVEEGATVRIVVEFQPKFNLAGGTPVGRHNGSLELDVAGKAASVSLDAFFEGLNIGVLVVPLEREATILASSVYEKHVSGGNQVLKMEDISFGYEVEVVNPKEPARVWVKEVEMPPGVTLEKSLMFPSSPDDLRLSTDVAPSGRSTATLLFTLRFNGPEAASAHHGMGQEIVVAYGSGNIERTLVFTLNFLPEQRLFSMRKKVDNVMCEFSVLVNTDGLMHVAYNLSSTNYFPQDIAMTLYVGNEQLVQISKDTGHIPELNGDNRHKAARSDIVLRSPYGKADFARLFTLPWAFRVKVFEHL